MAHFAPAGGGVGLSHFFVPPKSAVKNAPLGAAGAVRRPDDSDHKFARLRSSSNIWHMAAKLSSGCPHFAYAVPKGQQNPQRVTATILSD